MGREVHVHSIIRITRLFTSKVIVNRMMNSVILVLVITLGVLQANALVDQEPVAKDGYTKENSPTCFYGCSGYAPNYCEASWENCNPAFKGWKVKDFCKKSCYVPPVEDPCSPNPCQNNGVCV